MHFKRTHTDIEDKVRQTIMDFAPSKEGKFGSGQTNKGVLFIYQTNLSLYVRDIPGDDKCQPSHRFRENAIDSAENDHGLAPFLQAVLRTIRVNNPSREEIPDVLSFR